MSDDVLKRARVNEPAPKAEGAVPVRTMTAAALPQTLKSLSAPAARWVKTSGFGAEPGEHLVYPDEAGAIVGVLFGIAPASATKRDPLSAGKLARALPAGDYRLIDNGDDPFGFTLGWALGAYSFTRYKAANAGAAASLDVPDGVDAMALRRIVEGVYLARDLINTPANDMGPDELEQATRTLAGRHNAEVRVVTGEALLENNFPMIHAVGRASDRAPRLIEMVWGKASDPKVTLVGKGVCFDTGGLNLKPSGGMALMKKDMGGAANVLGLASMIMSAKLGVRLRVLIPAVDNNVSANAFRPGDVLQSRKGLSVEIGNTDAEGRLVLADALALADEEAPQLVIDMATLTGAARVALGPELPPFYTNDDDVASAIAAHADKVADPLWRMPLWAPYDSWLDSKIADVNHISDGGFAGSITAALFLARFVEQARAHVHFDIYGWAPKDRPAGLQGGEAQAIRALFSWLGEAYPPGASKA